jgi:hypothetical protein
MINYGVGMVLDAVLHPAPEAVTAPIEPAGEPASVVVDLPPPLTPRVAPAATPQPAAPAAIAPRRSSHWGAEFGARRYRHGWGSRRWPQKAAEPGQAPTVAAMLDPHPGASHASATPLVRIDGLPKHIIDGGGTTEKIAKPATPSPVPAATKP